MVFTVKNTFVVVEVPPTHDVPLRRSNSIPRDMKIKEVIDDVCDISTDCSDLAVWQDLISDTVTNDGSDPGRQSPSGTFDDSPRLDAQPASGFGMVCVPAAPVGHPMASNRGPAQWGMMPQFSQDYQMPPPPPLSRKVPKAQSLKVEYVHEEHKGRVAKSSGLENIVHIISMVCFLWASGMNVEFLGRRLFIRVTLKNKAEANMRLLQMRQALDDPKGSKKWGVVDTDIEKCALKIRTMEDIVARHDICYEWDGHGSCCSPYCRWAHPKYVVVRVFLQ